MLWHVMERRTYFAVNHEILLIFQRVRKTESRLLHNYLESLSLRFINLFKFDFSNAQVDEIDLNKFYFLV